MDTGSIIVIILRLVIPLSIFRYPLAGVIACMTLDTLDVALVDILGGGRVFRAETIGYSYQRLDKALDTYYLLFALIVSLRWENRLARRTSIILFSYRFVGVVLFLATDWRTFLVIFPNIFEYFFVFYLTTQKFFPRFRLDSTSRLLVVLLIIGLPVLCREYIYHHLQVSIVDTVNALTPLQIEGDSIWQWLKGRLFR